MSTEPNPSPAPASSNDKGKGKGKAREVTEDGDAASSSNTAVKGANGADQSSSLNVPVSSENKENETPEALREQLEAVRRELRASLEKKQGIDRQLVCGPYNASGKASQAHSNTYRRRTRQRYMHSRLRISRLIYLPMRAT